MSRESGNEGEESGRHGVGVGMSDLATSERSWEKGSAIIQITHTKVIFRSRGKFLFKIRKKNN